MTRERPQENIKSDNTLKTINSGPPVIEIKEFSEISVDDTQSDEPFTKITAPENWEKATSGDLNWHI
jgi:hypothetical protein